jgi:hypothetical protein
MWFARGLQREKHSMETLPLPQGRLCYAKACNNQPNYLRYVLKRIEIQGGVPVNILMLAGVAGATPIIPFRAKKSHITSKQCIAWIIPSP